MTARLKHQRSDGSRPLRDAVPLGVLVAASCAAAAQPGVIHERQILIPTPTAIIEAVDIDGNRLVLGASSADDPGIDTGAVHIFDRSPAGTWLQTARLQDSAGAPCNRFGRAVDIEGDTLITNHWNWLRLCEVGGYYDDKRARLHAFTLDAGVWMQTFTGEKDYQLPVDLAFDGTSVVGAFDAQHGFARTRAADGTWSIPPVPLSSVGTMYNDWESHGLHVDIHDGFAAIGGLYMAEMSGQEPWDLPAATLYQRSSSGQWQHVSDVHVAPQPERKPLDQPPARTRVSVGPQQRLAINEFIYEPDTAGQYVETASLRPACTSHRSIVSVEFDVEGDLAVVQTSPHWIHPVPESLWSQGRTLHLYRRLAPGEWETVAQLIPSGGRYDGPPAIDGGSIVSGTKVYDATDPVTSHAFSDFDECLGHRGNWVELTPQRWAITYQGGRAYSIDTSDYVNQTGDRPGEYTLLNHHLFGDFDFTVKARSDEVLGPWSAADYVVIFGYRNELNYYYMMFSRYAINNELFKVVDGVRQKIARAPHGSFLDNAFHQVDIQRRGNDIDILFDGNPYLSVTDDTFGAGAIGIGSYNDAVSFDDIDVVGYEAPDLT